MSQAAQPQNIADSLVGASALQTEFNFYTLPRPIQDRFVASTNGAGVPHALLARPSTESGAYLWLLGLVASVLAVGAIMVVGFGNLQSTMSLQPKPLGLAYLALCGIGGACANFYIAARGRKARYPYQLGTYLFPVGIVTANNEQLKLFPWASLQECKTTKKKATFVYPGQRFTFALPPNVNGDKFRADVGAYRGRFEEAIRQGNRRELAVLDPLRDSGFSNPLSSMDPLAPDTGSQVARLVFLGVLGAALGAVVFLARNKVAERYLYKAVRAADTTQAYEAYLSRGGKRPEVASVLLPLAQLADARGSLPRVEAFATANPESLIRAKIDEALREELLAALDVVKKENTLKALQAFRKAHPAHAAVEKELKAARHDVFKSATKSYIDGAQSGLSVQQFMEELIGFSEEHGPRIEFRFRQQIPISVERADTLLRRSVYFVGNSSLPSQYFSTKYSEPREAAVMNALLDGFQSRFPKEVLEFVQGESLKGKGTLPEVEVPTLFISYKTEMSGAYTTLSPRGVFVGLGLMVRTEFHIPGREKPFILRKHSSWLPPDTGAIYKNKLTPEQVYNRNAKEGFDRYTQRMLRLFLPETLETKAKK